jgi:hypothetical protein
MELTKVEIEVVGVGWDGGGGVGEHGDIVGVGDTTFGDDFMVMGFWGRVG